MTQTFQHQGCGTDAGGPCGGHAHNHGHDFSGFTDDRRLIWALVVIVSFGVIEIIGGLVSGSLALLADAGHMAMDGFAIGLALWARHLATKPSTAAFPFGQKRAQVLAAFVNAVLLFALIGVLGWESMGRLTSSTPPDIGTGVMLTVAILGLGANFLAFWILHSGDRQDVNMRGAMLHVISDILGSVAAIASAVIIATTGWVAVDALVTLLVCGLIGRSAWSLLRETSHVLLQGAPPGFDPESIAKSLQRDVPGIQRVSRVRAWMLTPDAAHVTLTVWVDDPAFAGTVLRDVKKMLATQYRIENATVEIDYDPVVRPVSVAPTRAGLGTGELGKIGPDPDVDMKIASAGAALQHVPQ